MMHPSQVALLALEGDALLKLAVVRHLTARARAGADEAGGAPGVQELDVGRISTAASAAVSNALLHAEMASLLPDAAGLAGSKRVAAHVKEGGTAVEAAIALVARAEGDDCGAIAALVRYLVERTTAAASPDAVRRALVPQGGNAKGALLERGGTVTSERAGGPPHMPVFAATATLDDMKARATAGSKREAERLAAAKLLGGSYEAAISSLVSSLDLAPRGQRVSLAAERAQEGEAAGSEAKTAGARASGDEPPQTDNWTFEAYEFPDERRQAILKGGESSSQWFTRKLIHPGADTFQVAMQAAACLPTQVSRVESWLAPPPPSRADAPHDNAGPAGSDAESSADGSRGPSDPSAEVEAEAVTGDDPPPGRYVAVLRVVLTDLAAAAVGAGTSERLFVTPTVEESRTRALRFAAEAAKEWLLLLASRD